MEAKRPETQQVEPFQNKLASIFGFSSKTETTNAKNTILQSFLAKFPVPRMSSGKKRTNHKKSEHKPLPRKKNHPKKPCPRKKTGSNGTFDMAREILKKNAPTSVSFKYRALSNEKLLDSFKALDKLKKIEISNCDLLDEKISGTLFKNCKELKHLILVKNNIKCLEQNIFQQLKLMDTLILSTNQIEKINEATFHTCINLSHLDLSNNNLEVISENMFICCKNLEILNLANNKIAKFEKRTLNELKMLRYFTIANNLLTQLDSSVFEDCADICKIDVSGNQIANLNDDFIIELVRIN